MAVTLSDAHYVINSYGTFDSVHDELQNAIDRADFISQPGHSGEEVAYVVPAIKVVQAV